jgi:hypothetical protein
LCLIIFFWQSCCSWDSVKNCGTVRQATDDNIILRICIACWLTKAADTHSEYVIFIAFPRQRLLHMEYYICTCIACLVTCSRWVPGKNCELKFKFMYQNKNCSIFTDINPCVCHIMLFNIIVNAKLSFFGAVNWKVLHLIYTHTHTHTLMWMWHSAVTCSYCSLLFFYQTNMVLK